MASPGSKRHWRLDEPHCFCAEAPVTRTRAVVAVALVALVAAVFGQVRGHEFVDFDDYIYIVHNPHIRAGLTPESVAGAFTTPHQGQWTPVSRISFQIDQELHGLDPGAVLLTNVAYHTCATLLLFFWLAGSTGATWRSAFVAATFAIHPLHVESVAWATERKDVVAAVFFMLALLCHAGYVARPSWPRYGLLLLVAGAGLLSKPMLVTLPCVLLLLDYWPHARLGRRAVLEKLPLFAMAAAASTGTWIFLRAGGATAYGERVDLAARLANAVDSYVFYLRETLWPSGLAFFYPHPLDSLPAARVAAGALLLAALSAGAVRQARSNPPVLVGWLWFLGMLVPVIGLVQVGAQAHADRYAYLPMVGLGIAVAWGAAQLARSTAAARALGAVGVAAVLALAGAAWVQVGTWRNSSALFERGLSIHPESAFVHQRLATLRLRLGVLAEAEHHYQRSFDLSPELGRDPLVMFHLGMADRHRSEEDSDRALARYRQALEVDPEHVRASRLFGLALVERGELAMARGPLERALRGEPGNARLHAALASVSVAQGFFAEGVASNREALRLDPSLSSARNNLVWMLATCPDSQQRDPAEALALAQRLDGADPQQLDTRAAAQAAAGRFHEAVATVERAIELAEAQGQRAAVRVFQLHAERYRRGEAWTDVVPEPDPPR